MATAIPARLNAGLAAGFVALSLFQLFGLPVLIQARGVWWALLLLPCTLGTTTNWALIHEAIHGLLMPDKKANDACGRILAIFFGSPFESLRFPHLLHHHMNGMTGDRPEYYDGASTSRGGAALTYFPKLVLGIYTVECAGTFLCLLPRPLLRKVIRAFPRAHENDSRAETYLLEPRRLSRLRRDSLAIIAIYALAFWLYARWWPLFALSILGRGVLVSVADNAYHYGAPLGAGARSAYNLELRGAKAILNFNLHQVHHLHPTLPWNGLPAAFARDGSRYHVGYLTAMLRQFEGPISDRDYARVPHLPSNFGARFSKNAEMPSRTS